jgi:phasin family protein
MTEGLNPFFARASELGGLTAEHAGKVAEIQLKSLREATLLGIERFKAATEVRDADGLKTYLAGNADALQKLGERTIEDTRALVELTSSFAGTAQRIFSEALRIG